MDFAIKPPALKSKTPDNAGAEFYNCHGLGLAFWISILGPFSRREPLKESGRIIPTMATMAMAEIAVITIRVQLIGVPEVADGVLALAISHHPAGNTLREECYR